MMDGDEDVSLKMKKIIRKQSLCKAVKTERGLNVQVMSQHNTAAISFHYDYK